jgi:hypothetical protein
MVSILGTNVRSTNEIKDTKLQLIVEYDHASAVTVEAVPLKPLLDNSLQVTKLLLEDVICRRVVKGKGSEGIAQRHITRGVIASMERGRAEVHEFTIDCTMHGVTSASSMDTLNKMAP